MNRTVFAIGCVGIGLWALLTAGAVLAEDSTAKTPAETGALFPGAPAPGLAEKPGFLAVSTPPPLWGLDFDAAYGGSGNTADGELDGTSAQMPGANASIFQRFSSGRDTSKSWQTMFELPVGLYPQTDQGAHIIANEGINWVTSYLPLNRVYFGRSIGYARMEWEPGGQLDTIQVVQWDWTEILNIAVRPWWVISFGLGVGFMDGMIFYKDGSFKHRLELYLPVQVGTGFRLGRNWFVDGKLLQSSYFGPGPVASAARSMIGIGYNY